MSQSVNDTNLLNWLLALCKQFFPWRILGNVQSLTPPMLILTHPSHAHPHSPLPCPKHNASALLLVGVLATQQCSPNNKAIPEDSYLPLARECYHVDSPIPAARYRVSTRVCAKVLTVVDRICSYLYYLFLVFINLYFIIYSIILLYYYFLQFLWMLKYNISEVRW